MTSQNSNEALRSLAVEIDQAAQRAKRAIGTGPETLTRWANTLDALAANDTPARGGDEADTPAEDQEAMDAAVDAFREELDDGGSLWACVQAAVRAAHCHTPPGAVPALAGGVGISAPTGQPPRDWTAQERADAQTAMNRIHDREAAAPAPAVEREAAIWCGCGDGIIANTGAKCGTCVSTTPPAEAREPVGDAVIGEVVEIGNDDEGQPRILIHTTREAIQNGPTLAFRTVAVSLAATPKPEAVDKAEGADTERLDWLESEYSHGIVSLADAASSSIGAVQWFRGSRGSETLRDSIDRHRRSVERMREEGGCIFFDVTEETDDAARAPHTNTQGREENDR